MAASSTQDEPVLSEPSLAEAESFLLRYEFQTGADTNRLTGKDKKNDQPVRLRRATSLRSDNGLSLLYELAFCSRVEHDSVPKVLEVAASAKGLTAVFSAPTGKTLEQIYADSGPRSSELEVLKYGLEIASLAAAAHAANFLLLEIGPENFIVDGKSKRLSLERATVCLPLESSSARERIGEMLVGLPGYMAPEQVTNASQLGPHTDVFGIGATLFRLLSGKPIYEGDSISETLAQTRNASIPDLVKLRKSVNPKLAKIVNKCLSKLPEQRPATAQELVLQLRSLLTDMGEKKVAGASIFKLVSITKSFPPKATLQDRLHGHVDESANYVQTAIEGQAAQKKKSERRSEVDLEAQAKADRERDARIQHELEENEKAEQAQMEAAAAEAEKVRLEKERVENEQKERERQEQLKRDEEEKARAEEQARAEKEHADAEQKERERKEQLEREEQERICAEDIARAEKERTDAERKERDRQEQLKREQEEKEQAARQEREAAEIAEKKERERKEKEREELEKRERERIEKERKTKKTAPERAPEAPVQPNYSASSNPSGGKEVMATVAPAAPVIKSSDVADVKTISNSEVLSKLSTVPADRYQIRREITLGGQGACKVAFDQLTEREIVLKTSGPQSGWNAERIVKEARFAAKMNHPNVTRLLELGSLGKDQVFMSMPYIEGASLDVVIKKISDSGIPGLTGYSVTAVAELFDKICAGVEHAHSAGLLHLDLKPQNVVVGSRGEVVVVDWGNGQPTNLGETPKRYMSNEQPATPTLTTTLTGALTSDPTVRAVGTPAYMSPEQWVGDPGTFTERTDVYGVGAMLFFLLTGTAPNQVQRPTDLEPYFRHSPTPSPSEFTRRRVPPELESLCVKCLARDPALRFPTVFHVRHELKTWLSRPEMLELYRQTSTY